MKRIKYISRDGGMTYRGAYSLRGRRNCPALIMPNGTAIWYMNNLIHRWDGPAVLQSDGEWSWWKDGSSRDAP